MVQIPAPVGTTVSPLDLRRACGQFATGVTVVTMQDGTGARGMTANSFTSVSLDPPLILVSVDNRNRTHELLSTGGRFVVNVLGQEHRSWSDRFAGRFGAIQDRFDDVSHRLVDGIPILDGALAVFACRVVAAHPAGDHTLFLGHVEQLERRDDGDPLLFFRGQYGAVHNDERMVSPMTSETDYAC